MKNAKVFYISNGNLYSSPKDGTYRVLIEKDVKNCALIKNNRIYFIVDSISGGNLASYSYKSYEKEIYSEYKIKGLYLWSSGTGAGELKEPIPDNFYPYYNYVNLESGYVSKTYVPKEKDVLLSEGKLSEIETSETITTDGWSITKNKNKLIFSNGNTTNRISGKKLFLIGSV